MNFDNYPSECHSSRYPGSACTVRTDLGEKTLLSTSYVATRIRSAEGSRRFYRDLHGSTWTCAPVPEQRARLLHSGFAQVGSSSTGKAGVALLDHPIRSNHEAFNE